MCILFVALVSAFVSSNLVLGFTNITFDNDFAIFKLEDVLRFDVGQEMDILFVENPKDPSLQNCVYGLSIKHTNARDKFSSDTLYFQLYKDGILQDIPTNKYELTDKADLKNMELNWDRKGHIEMNINSLYREPVFSWMDSEHNDMRLRSKYIAVKMKNATTIHSKDSFMWLSDLLQVCPNNNAYISCNLEMNMPEINSTQNNYTGKYLRTIMKINLQSKHDSSQYYEFHMVVDETKKNEPLLYISKNNSTKLRMISSYGSITLRINISDHTLAISNKNDETPTFVWTDLEEANNLFRDIRYVTVQTKETPAVPPWSSDKPFVNACQIRCNRMMKKSSTWTRLKNWFKKSSGGHETESKHS